MEFTGSWCHFSQRTELTDSQRTLYNYKSDQSDIRYSYIILKKGPRPTFSSLKNGTGTTNNPEFYDASFDWSRMIVPPSKRSRHVQMDLCSSVGEIHRIIVPQSQGKLIYTDARKSHWGDLWPHPPKGKPVVFTNFDKAARNTVANPPQRKKRIHENDDEGNDNDNDKESKELI